MVRTWRVTLMPPRGPAPIRCRGDGLRIGGRRIGRRRIAPGTRGRRPAILNTRGHIMQCARIITRPAGAAVLAPPEGDAA